METVNSDIRKRINKRELYRYLGYGANTPDSDMQSMVEDVLDNLINAIKPRHIYKIYHCNTSGADVVLKTPQGGTLIFESKNLADNLAQCGTVALLAATLGIEADKLLQKYEILNMAKAAIIQACGAACIEAYCDILQERIRDACSADGSMLYLRPRFSAGYGDLALENQKKIFDELECTKRIGLTLTDSLLMYPTKSVTAFIGLTANPKGCHTDKCKNCEKTDCEFRGGV